MSGKIPPQVLLNTTWTALPAANSVPVGIEAWVSDVGANGGRWRNSGTEWFPVAPVTLFTQTDAYARAPSGTINTGSSGNITFGTAANRVYSEGLWVRLPSIATTPAITAGDYWCVMSNATTGTLYSSKGGSAINFTVGASYTGVTTQINFPSYTLKGGLMGSSRRISISGMLNFTNNSNGKSFYWYVGARTSGNSFVGASQCPIGIDVRNKASNLQVVTPTMYPSGVGSTTYSAIDTTLDQLVYPLMYTGTTATDWIIVDAWSMTLHPS